ncbi:MAG: Ni/Fe hydrogenase subunit alpha [Patescibacteria group bacterium]|nr:Ni/Fe hydrogenase subunit alpha [Patescibacteria group bacterium]
MRIKINHISKIEGHAGFEAELYSGRIKNALVETKEGARLVESILRGRDYHEAFVVTQRICGVCPVVHNLTAIKAMENALGVKISAPNKLLRKVLENGQIIQSHALHAYFMAVGDYFGLDSALDLVKKFPEISQKALKVRELGNKSIDYIGGRTIHPLRTKVGGFTKLPDQEKLEWIIDNTSQAIETALKIVELYKKIKFPEFERKTEFLALKNSEEYAIYEGHIATTDGLNIPVEKFEHNIKEIQIPYQMAKRAQYKGKPYMVGAIARMHLSKNKLRPKAKKLIKELPKFPIYNNFYNLFCQAIEMVHLLEDSQIRLKKYLKMKSGKASVDFKVKNGQGVGSVEAPRGTLYHYYELDKQGKIKNCNIITPTVQMLSNLEADLAQWIPAMKYKKIEKEEKIKMLIRAYDPCITCATH